MRIDEWQGEKYIENGVGSFDGDYVADVKILHKTGRYIVTLAQRKITHVLKNNVRFVEKNGKKYT